MQTYRPDIDGLRALAIIPVVFYHAAFPAFSGGFVGVDIFFVVSGYLITGLVWGNIREDKFSLLGFYERRARRILPALFAISAFSLVAALLLFLPSDFKDFAKSLVATQTFASNVLFWLEAGYFAAPSELKPLLHTWSLGVEEQFYIVFPVSLILIHKYFRKFLPALLVCGLFVSLALSVWGVEHKPTATFYLFPTRAWELLLGATLALEIVPNLRNRTALNWMGFAGIAFICFSVFAYDSNTKFPGLSAVIPCLGTYLVIYSSSKQLSLVGRVLSLRPFVFFGLISYSLYLWHWPLLAFSKYYLERKLTIIETTAIIAFSLLLAWISWRYVEQPFRGKRALLSRKSLFRWSAMVATILIAVGLAGDLMNGFPQRIPPQALAFAEAVNENNPWQSQCYSIPPERVRRYDLCILGVSNGSTPDFIIWGDSHADAMMPMFKALAEQYAVWGWHASYTGCPPLIGIVRVDQPPSHQCREFNDAVLSIIQEKRIPNVVLVSRWSVYPLGWEEDSEDARLADPFIRLDNDSATSRLGSMAAFEVSFADTIAALDLIGAKVWLIEQVPVQVRSVPHMLLNALWFRKDLNTLGRLRKEHEQRQRFITEVFSKFPTLRRINPADKLCGLQEHCLVVAEGKALYYDDEHLSISGALWLSDLFVPMFDQFKADRKPISSE